MIENILRKHYPLLTEKSLIEEIIQVGQLMSFDAGDKLMDYGRYIKMVPLVIKGAVRVLRQDEDGNELFLYYLNAGETCAMAFTCCMANKQSTVCAIAEEDTQVISVPIKYLDLWMNKYQSWKNFVLQSYSGRMEEMLKTIDSIAFKNMDERLVQYLKEKSKAVNSNTLPITHSQIAQELNASREAVSRLLKKLEKQNKIVLGRNKIECVAI